MHSVLLKSLPVVIVAQCLNLTNNYIAPMDSERLDLVKSAIAE